MRVYIAVVGRLGDTRRGATVVEYALILAFVAGVCVSAITAFSGANSNLYSKMNAIASAILH